MNRVADYLIHKIVEAGATSVFLVSGRGILYLTDAIAKNTDISAVSMMHEQGASFAAMAYSRAKQGVSACVVSTGCAATNAITACLCAFQDNLPVVFISGNNPLKENTRHTGIKIRTYGSQEADIISVVEPITKRAIMLENIDEIVYEVEKALWIAQSGRPGPVWIDIPLDVQNMRIEEREQKHFAPTQMNYNNQTEINQIVNELNESERPIILIGGGCQKAKGQIKELIVSANIPVVFSPAAADVFGSSNDLSIGAVGSIGGSRAGNFAIQNADYVLAIGTKLNSQLTGRAELFARAAKITVVDIDAEEHKKKGVDIQRILIDEVSHFIGALLEKEFFRSHSEWVNKCLHWKSLFSIANEGFINELIESNKIDLYSFIDLLSDVITEDTTIITDAGFEELIVPSTLRFKEGQICLFPPSQGSMGYAIPAVVGAYKAGRKNIIVIVGDGSIMMNIQELQIISAMHIPVKIFVINNNMYAVIRKRQRDLFRNRTIGNDPSDGVPAPNFENISKCFGFDYRKIANRKELLDYIPKIYGANMEIVEVMCDENQKYFHESFAFSEKRKIIHRPIEDMSPFLDRQCIKKEMIIECIE